MQGQCTLLSGAVRGAGHVMRGQEGAVEAPVRSVDARGVLGGHTWSLGTGKEGELPWTRPTGVALPAMEASLLQAD